MLADPIHGAQRRYKSNVVFATSCVEALELVRQGFAIHMSSGRSAPSLVAAGLLELVERSVASLDDLWTFNHAQGALRAENGTGGAQAAPFCAGFRYRLQCR